MPFPSCSCSVFMQDLPLMLLKLTTLSSCIACSQDCLASTNHAWKSPEGMVCSSKIKQSQVLLSCSMHSLQFLEVYLCTEFARCVVLQDLCSLGSTPTAVKIS